MSPETSPKNEAAEAKGQKALRGRKLTKRIVETVIVALIAATPSTIKAVLEHRDRRREIELKEEAQRRAASAESNAQKAQAHVERLEKDRATIRAFIAESKTYLSNIKDLLSQMKENVKVSEERDVNQRQLVAEVRAYGKFISDWKKLRQSLEPLLDGDNEAIVAAAQKPNVTAIEIDEISTRRDILERNLNSKQGVLLQSAGELAKDVP